MKHVVSVGPRRDSPPNMAERTRLILPDSEWGCSVLGKLLFMGHDLTVTSEDPEQVENDRSQAELDRRDILIALHRCDEEVNRFTGEVRQVPHSMAVASMPKAEFERLYDDTMALLAEDLGCDPELLLQEAA